MPRTEIQEESRREPQRESIHERKALQPLSVTLPTSRRRLIRLDSRSRSPTHQVYILQEFRGELQYNLDDWKLPCVRCGTAGPWRSYQGRTTLPKETRTQRR